MAAFFSCLQTIRANSKHSSDGESFNFRALRSQEATRSLKLDAFVSVTFTMPMIDDGFEALLEPFYNGKKLTDPISTKEDKFQLLPAFLKVKGMLSTVSHEYPCGTII